MANEVTDWAVLLGKDTLQMPYSVGGDLPGSEPPDDGDMFAGTMEKVPVDPRSAMAAMMSTAVRANSIESRDSSFPNFLHLSWSHW